MKTIEIYLKEMLSFFCRNNFFYKSFLLVIIGFFPFANATSLTNNVSQQDLVFAIVQDQFIFNYSNIKSASISYRSDGSYNGLHLTLKPEAAHEFTRLTHIGIGKPIILFFGNKIISMSMLRSELTGDLLITGVAKTDAINFVDMLYKHQQEINK